MNFKLSIKAAGLWALLLLSQQGFALSELASAIQNADADLVRTLLRREADVNAIERDGSTALLWAVYEENPRIVALLLKAGADVETPNRDGMTALSMAAATGNHAVVKLLVDAGADVNRSMANGETPLMMAARTGNLDTIALLLDRGAAIDAVEDLRGTSALMWAAANRNAPAVQLLVERGANINLKSAASDVGRNTPYLAPTARERIREFYQREGISRAIDVKVEGEDDGRVSFEELVKRLPPDLIRDFEAEEKARAEQDANKAPAKKHRGGLAPLHFAVREGDMDTVNVLVEAGADVNLVSEYGWTPLLTATQNRFYQIGAYLLEHGANPNIANEGGWNPLYIATDNRNIEGGDYPTRKPDMDHLAFIKLLLQAGADPNIRMASSTETRTVFTHQWLQEPGATPFLRAAQSSDLVLMNLLLEHGADPNIATTNGVTPLMVAAGIGWVEGVTFEWSEAANEEALRMLLQLGNDVNAQDLEDHRSALMGAAHKGRDKAVQILVDAGGDLSLHDIGSRDSLNKLAGATWQALDYAEGLVRVGVQSAETHVSTAALIRKLMKEQGLEVPPEGRTLDSICVVDLCR